VAPIRVLWAVVFFGGPPYLLGIDVVGEAKMVLG
jgi:hypothetical protein